MQRFRIETAKNHAISDTIRRAYESRQATLDRVYRNFDNWAIRGVEEHTNPISGQIETVPITHPHAWVNALGEHIYSSELNFNPNEQGQTGWHRMPATQSR